VTLGLSILSEKHTLRVLENEVQRGISIPTKQKQLEDKQNYTLVFFSMAQQPLVGQGLLII
jgi:hypothetical protein